MSQMKHFEWDIFEIFWARHFEWDILNEVFYVRQLELRHLKWDILSVWERYFEWDIIWVRHFNWGLEGDILSETFWSAFFGPLVPSKASFLGVLRYVFAHNVLENSAVWKKEGGTTLIKLQQSTCAKVQPSLVSTLESTFAVQVCTNEKQHRVQ